MSKVHHYFGLIDKQGAKRKKKGLESVAFKLQMMVIMWEYINEHKKHHKCPFDEAFIKNEILKYEINK